MHLANYISHITSRHNCTFPLIPYFRGHPQSLWPLRPLTLSPPVSRPLLLSLLPSFCVTRGRIFPRHKESRPPVVPSHCRRNECLLSNSLTITWPMADRQLHTRLTWVWGTAPSIFHQFILKIVAIVITASHNARGKATVHLTSSFVKFCS